MRRVSETSLMNAALFYLGRYVPSVKQLERVLLRKCRRTIREKGGDLESARPLVATVLERLARAGYLDDARLAEALAASLRRGGRSSRLIAQKLQQKGLDRSLAVAHARATSEEEEAAAWVLARKKRLGPFSRQPLDQQTRRKQLAALARAGYPFALARRIVDATEPHAGPPAAPSPRLGNAG
jgi:regulatory protein